MFNLIKKYSQELLDSELKKQFIYNKDEIFNKIINNEDIKCSNEFSTEDFLNYTADNIKDNFILGYILKHKNCTDIIVKKILNSTSMDVFKLKNIINNSNISFELKKNIIENTSNELFVLSSALQILQDINNDREIKNKAKLIQVFYNFCKKYLYSYLYDKIIGDIIMNIASNKFTPMDVLIDLMSNKNEHIRTLVLSNDQLVDVDDDGERHLKEDLPEGASLIFDALRTKPWLDDKKYVTLDPGGARKLQQDEIEDFYEQDKYIDAFRPNGFIVTKLIKKYSNNHINNINVKLDEYLKLIKKYAIQKITFPKSEHTNLKNMLNKRKSIYTTRVSSEFNKYKKGKIYLTPWGDKIIVCSLKRFDDINNHPFVKKTYQKTKRINIKI